MEVQVAETPRDLYICMMHIIVDGVNNYTYMGHCC